VSDQVLNQFAAENLTRDAFLRSYHNLNSNEVAAGLPNDVLVLALFQFSPGSVASLFMCLTLWQVEPRNVDRLSLRLFVSVAPTEVRECDTSPHRLTAHSSTFRRSEL
jgi:hypothetical protein